MPYNPGITYDFSPLFAGINRLGQGVGEAIQRYNDIHDQADVNDQLMAFLANTPDPTDPETDPEKQRKYLPKDAYSRYLALSQRQRALGGGQLLGAMRMLEHAKAAEQDRQTQQLLYGAHALNYLAGSGGGGLGGGGLTSPTVQTITDPQTGIKHTYVQESRNQWRRLPRPGEIHQDPTTGLYGTYDKNGVFHTIDPLKIQEAQQTQQRQQGQGAGQQRQPEPSWWQRIFGGGGGGAGAAPTPTPTPGATPAPQAAPEGGGPVRVQTPAEAAQLPPGTQYQTPDGTIYVR
jgi:hypothetical protein